MKGRITEKGEAVVELMEHEGISLEEALERIDPPAGRGDATQPDPAMIEQAANLVYDVLNEDDWIVPQMVRSRDYSDLEALKAADQAADAANAESVRRAVVAAAAVIVPATAEAIAAAIEATQVNNALQFAVIARSFAAGLSAGATTGGDSDVATSIWPLLPSSAGGTDPIGGDGDGQQ